MKEAAERRGISEHRVQKPCAENRIPNAQRFGRSRMTPKDAERPDDLGRKPSAENHAEDN